MLATDVTAFVGVNGGSDPGNLPVNAVGLQVTTANLGLVVLKPTGDGTAGTNLFALEADALSVNTLGLPPDLNVSASDLLVQVNRTGGAFTHTIAIGGASRELNGGDPLADGLTLIQAEIDIDVAGFVSLSGTVTLEFGTLAAAVRDTPVQQSSETLSDATLVAIGVTNATAFVGINEGEPGETGVAVTVDELALALIQPADAGDTRHWVGLQGRVSQAMFSSPSPALEIAASTLTLALNQKADDDTFVDFTQIDRDGQGGADGGLTITTGPASTETLTFNAAVTQATGQISIDVAGFVRLSGAFTFSQSTLASVHLSDGTNTSTLSNAHLLTVGGSNVSGFVGLNAGQPGALGFSVDVDEFALVVIQPAESSDTRQWLALEANVSNASFVGLADTLELSASELTVAINTTASLDGTFVDFAQSSSVSVETGISTRTFDFEARLIRASGQVTIGIAGFVQIDGNFAFEKTTLATVALRDAAGIAVADLTDAQLLTVGASGVTGFVGLNAGEPGAVGFEVTVDEFALAVIRPADGADTRQWVALETRVSEPSFVGLNPELVLSATVLTVEVNAAASDGTYVDFSGSSPVLVETGISTRIFSFDRPLIRAAGQVTIDLAGFVQVSGNFAFEKSTLASVVVADAEQNETTLANAQLLSVGASNVTGFVGLNAGQPGAVGLTVTVDEFALAVIQPADGADTRQWTALQADLSSATSLGLEPVTFSADDLSVEINTAAGDGTVLDFTQVDRDGVGGLDGRLRVITGPDQTMDFVDLDFAEALVEASGQVSLAVAGFVGLNGAFGIRKAGDQLEATADGVDVTFALEPVFTATATGGTLGLVAQPDGTVAFQAGFASLSLTAADFANVTTGQVTVQFNNTGIDFSGANQLELDFNGIAATIDVADGVTSFSVQDLRVDFADFVTVQGDFGFRRTGTAPNQRIEATASDLSIDLTLGDQFTATASGGSLALVIEADGTTALQAELGGLDITAGPFANVTSGPVTVKFNSDPLNSVTVAGGLDIDGVMAALDVPAGALSFSVQNLVADFGGFVTIQGNFGFRKIGGRIEATANSVEAKVTAGSVEIGVTGGALALVLSADGTQALEASGGSLFNVPGFDNVSVVEIRVTVNDTVTDYLANPLQLDIDGVTATLSAAPGSESVSVTGLSVEIPGFVSLSGNFAFRRVATGGGDPQIQATAEMVQAALSLSRSNAFSAGVTNGSLALVIDQTAGVTTKAFTITGAAFLMAADFAEISVQSATVRFNDTATDYTIPQTVGETFVIGEDTFSVDLPAGSLLRVTADPLQVTILGTTLSGRFSFERTETSAGTPITVISADDISITGFSGEGTGGETVDISGAQGTLVIASGGVAGSLGFTTDDVGFGGFGANATLKLEINNTDNPIDVSGAFGAVLLEAGPFIRVVLADLTIELPGLEIEGDFSFQEATQGQNTIQVVVGNNVRVFVGDNSGLDPIGLELTNGQAVFLRDSSGGTPLEAGFITGRVQLLGVDGVTLDATLTLRVNEFAQAINQSFILDGEAVSIVFSADELGDPVTGSFVHVTGEDIDLAVAGTVEFRGSIAFTSRPPADNQPGKFLVGLSESEPVARCELEYQRGRGRAHGRLRPGQLHAAGNRHAAELQRPQGAAHGPAGQPGRRQRRRSADAQQPAVH